MTDLAAGLNRRDRRALAKALTLAENKPSEAEKLFPSLESPNTEPLTVGLTGAPGTGKSTLIKALLDCALKEGQKVCVLAVDPSSPFSGGSLLADRHRMTLSNFDPTKVFIRSLSSRGHLGGLSPGASVGLRLAKLYDFDLIILETVGVGQAEIEVLYLADLIAVTLVSGLGDEIQAMKSGLMEIADVFIVNKCKRPQTEELVADLEGLLSESPRYKGVGWKPTILQTEALSGEGISELWKFLRDAPLDPLFQEHQKSRQERQLYQQAFQSVMNHYRERTVEALNEIDFGGYSANRVHELSKEILRRNGEREG